MFFMKTSYFLGPLRISFDFLLERNDSNLNITSFVVEPLLTNIILQGTELLLGA